MRAIACLFLSSCLLVGLLGCGKAIGTNTPQAPSATTPSIPESTSTTITEFPHPKLQFPQEISFESRRFPDTAVAEPNTSDMLLIRSEKELHRVLDNIKQENSDPVLHKQICDAVDKYNADYFLAADLLLIGNADISLSVEQITLLDAGKLRIQTGFCTEFRDEQVDSLTGASSGTYKRMLVETDRKLPTELDVFWVKKCEQRHTLSPWMYQEYGEQMPYWVYYTVERVNGEYTEQDQQLVGSLVVPEAPTGLPNEQDHTETAVSFRAISLFESPESGEISRSLDLITSPETLEQVEQTLKKSAGRAGQKKTIEEAFTSYDEDYFEAGVLIVLKERIWPDQVSSKLEKIELLDDGTLAIQQSTVSLADTFYLTKTANLFAYYLIEIHAPVAEDTVIRYTDRHLFYPISAADLYFPEAPNRMLAYSESYHVQYYGLK